MTEEEERKEVVGYFDFDWFGDPAKMTMSLAGWSVNYENPPDHQWLKDFLWDVLQFNFDPNSSEYGGPQNGSYGVLALCAAAKYFGGKLTMVKKPLTTPEKVVIY